MIVFLIVLLWLISSFWLVRNDRHLDEYEPKFGDAFYDGYDA